MNFLTLERYTASDLVTSVERVTREAGLTNVFNPSVAFAGNNTYISFRAASSPGVKPFHAYILEIFGDGSTRLADLTEEVGTSLTKVADPKLVRLGEDVYVTFNTGTVHDGQNEIYLQRLTPARGPIQRCEYSARRPVEKNWGFYLESGGHLRAVYALAPFTALELSAGELGVTETLTFSSAASHTNRGHFGELHVGTQPWLIGDGRALVIANERVKIPPTFYRKAYLGRLAEIDLNSGEVVRLSSRRLLHSWRSMLPPQKERHNPVLWSATYFSGLTRIKDELMLSYGVNDKSLGIARVPQSALWG